MIAVDKIGEYEALLDRNDVVVDQDKRKGIIKKALLEAAGKAGCILTEDEELLDTVTFLVEKPYIVTCDFDPEFLKVPDVALIAR
jgi:glycyl-tRNA synthetase beta chain